MGRPAAQQAAAPAAAGCPPGLRSLRPSGLQGAANQTRQASRTHAPGRQVHHNRKRAGLPLHQLHGHRLHPSREGAAEVDLRVQGGRGGSREALPASSQARVLPVVAAAGGGTAAGTAWLAAVPAPIAGLAGLRAGLQQVCQLQAARSGPWLRRLSHLAASEAPHEAGRAEYLACHGPPSPARGGRAAAAKPGLCLAGS